MCPRRPRNVIADAIWDRVAIHGLNPPAGAGVGPAVVLAARRSAVTWSRATTVGCSTSTHRERRGRHMAKRLFTSESVTEGHPDKMADQISDAILDDLLRQDPDSRVAVESLLTTGQVHVAGEVTTRATPMSSRSSATSSSTSATTRR